MTAPETNAPLPPHEENRDGLLPRLEWLFFLTAIAAPVLIYPLRLQPKWLYAIGEYGAQKTFFARFVKEQIEPLAAFLYSPITLKMVAAAWAAVAFLAIYFARLALGKTGGAAGPDTRRLAWLRASPRNMAIGLPWLLFFGWMALGAVWSPTPLIAADALCFVVLFGLFGWVSLLRGFTPREARFIAGMIVVLGACVMALSYAEAFGQAQIDHDPNAQPLVFMFFERFEDVRNVFGSLMGHNTAAAMILVMSCFFALAFAMEARRRWVAVLNGAYVLLAIGCALIQQSRSGWIFGTVFGLLAVRSALRRSAAGRRCLPWLTTAFLALVAFGILSQFVKSPANPFYIKKYDLATRLKDLTPAHLLTETRVRIDYLGPRIVAEHPFVGHGLFAFQYVYPKVQGEYFRQHLDSPLYETEKRSHMAHNEYLQIAIDHGLIGLALAIAALAQIARRGWRRRRALHGSDRHWHEAFGWAGLVFSLHALVDFPFHIPQLALPGIACLFVWAAWRIPEEEDAAVHAMSPDSPPDSVPAPGPAASAFRPAHAARLLAAMTLLAAAPPAMLRFGRMLQADVEYNRGQAFCDIFEATVDRAPPVPQPDSFTSAVRHIQLSLYLQPGNALAEQFLARMHYLLGARQRIYFTSQRGKVPPAAADRIRAEALKNLNLARLEIEKSFEGLDNHQLYFMRALVFKELDKLAPNPAYRTEYMKSLDTGFSYCTNYMPLLYELVDALRKLPAPPVERIALLRRQIWRYDPDGFIAEYELPATKLFATGVYEQAAVVWEQIVAVDPTNTRWQYFYGETLFLTRQYDKARAAFMKVVQAPPAREDDYGIGRRMAPLYLAMIDKDWPRLRTLLEETDWSGDAHPLWFTAQRRALEDLLYARLKLPPPDPSKFQKPADASDADWNRLVEEDKLWVLSHYFDDMPASLAFIRAKIDGPNPHQWGQEFWIDAFNCARHMRQLDMADYCLNEVQTRFDNHPALKSFVPLMKMLHQQAGR